MSALPVIVGFGGFNAAGRASGHHAYRRMVLESLSPQERQETLAGLAVMMGLVTHTEGAYRDEGGQALELPEIEARFGQQRSEERRVGKEGREGRGLCGSIERRSKKRRPVGAQRQTKL